MHQQSHQHALVPLALAPQLKRTLKNARRPIHFFSEHAPSALHDQAFPNARYFWLEGDRIMHAHHGEKTALISLKELPELTFAQNWLIIAAALSLLNIPQSVLKNAHNFTLPGHRVEKIASLQGIDFYNDSKGTVIEATLAAVKKLQGKPIILFMGGISKGVDRSPVFNELKPLVKAIFTFGAEASLLARYAQQCAIPVFDFPTLDEAFSQAVAQAKPGDQLLFSPSGASFDLFAHYEERGAYFKKLVESLQGQAPL